MKRILFVDDEPRLLQGLRRMLRPYRKSWDMKFVEGGRLALTAMAEQPFDVVVSDMRMPGMDGATLLAKVQEQYPQTVRIILSGQTELEAALKTSPVTHQFLTKPCDANVLIEVITRSCNLRDLLNDETVRQMVGKMRTLPALPKVYVAIREALANPDVRLEDIAELVEEDMGMSAKILRTVNSGFFGVRQKIGGIRQAINFLGLNTVKNLALSVEMYQGNARAGMTRKLLERQQRHSNLVATLAMRLVVDPDKRDDVYMAGLMHDVGKLVLVTQMPSYYMRIITKMRLQGRSMYEMEREEMQITHAELGAYLLGLWGVPFPIIESVAHHHDPHRVEQATPGVHPFVYVANTLIHRHEAVYEGVPEEQLPELDMPYLEQLGVHHLVGDWEQIAREFVLQSGDKVSA